MEICNRRGENVNMGRTGGLGNKNRGEKAREQETE
jgi:hypothetical protein